MPRYALKIEYDGGPFAGWQRQKGQPSVQSHIDDALAKIEANVPSITAAGRTDAGVHALAQVAHCDMAKDWDPFRLSEALNYHLKPAPIAITKAVAVAQDFHARFSAIERRYRYHLIARRAPVTLTSGRVWHVRTPLDAGAMRAGAAHLIGKHDFTTFRSVNCQAQSPIKTVERVEIEEIVGDVATEFRIDVVARSFLHNQVRSIVGTLERVGAGAWQPDDVRQALAARDRTACGPVAPPQGLYLREVVYGHDPFF